MRRAGVAVFQHNFLARRQADVARRPQAAGPGQSGHRPPPFCAQSGGPSQRRSDSPQQRGSDGKVRLCRNRPAMLSPCPAVWGSNGRFSLVALERKGRLLPLGGLRHVWLARTALDQGRPRPCGPAETGAPAGCLRAGPGGEPGAESSSRTSCVALAASGGQVQAGPAASQVTRRSSIAERSARIRPGSALRRHSACGEAERPASAG